MAEIGVETPKQASHRNSNASFGQELDELITPIIMRKTRKNSSDCCRIVPRPQ